MDEIEDIVNLRKKYAYKLYEFYNYAQNQLAPISQNIIYYLEQSLIEEVIHWNKWQNKIEKLKKFNNEIKIFQKNLHKLTQNKLLELAYLRSSFEKQADDSKKHYLIILSKINNTRQSSMNDLTYELLSLAMNQPFLYELQAEVNRTFLQLGNHCKNWKNRPIHLLQKLSHSIYEIEILCKNILSDLDSFDTNSEDENIQYFDKLKNMFFVEQCSKLSDIIEKFFNSFDLQDLFTKFQSEHNQHLQSIFLENLGLNCLVNLRNNINIPTNLSATHKKIDLIYNYFKNLQSFFQPELIKLQAKKKKLISLCLNAEDLSKFTTEKWILLHNPKLFSSIDALIQQRLQEIKS